MTTPLPEDYKNANPGETLAELPATGPRGLSTITNRINGNTTAIAQLATNVKANGATGDGTTNDASAIQAIINALPSSGGVLYFPDGTYKIGSMLTCSKPVTFIGGAAATLRLSAAVALFAISSTSNIVFDNLTFDGDRDTIGAGTLALIYLDDVSNVVVRNCKFIDSQSIGIVLTRASKVWIEDNTFSNIYHSGIYLQNPGSGNHNEHIWIRNNCMTGVSVGEVGGHAGVQAYGISVAELSNRYIQVLNNTILDSHTVGIGLDSIDKSNISGNVVIRSAGSFAAECIAFTGSKNVFSENYCENKGYSQGAGILHWAVAGRTNEKNQIVNNRLTNNGQGVGFTWGQNSAVIDDLLIAGNVCYHNGFGIQSWTIGGVTGASQNRVVVRNNHFSDNGSPADPYTDIVLIDNSGGVTGSPTVEQLRPPPAFGPTLSSGIAGFTAWDSGFEYRCAATNTWKRVAIAAW